MWAIAAVGLVLSPAAAAEPSVARLLASLDLAHVPPETRAPPFQGQTVDGQAVSLAELHGRVVLLNFWASWCFECRPEMPQFEQLHQAYADQGLTVLGLNVRESVTTIRAYARELGLTFPLVLDPKGNVQKAYGVIGLPTTFAIDRRGLVVGRAIGPRDWDTEVARRLIEALLAIPPPPRTR